MPARSKTLCDPKIVISGLSDNIKSFLETLTILLLNETEITYFYLFTPFENKDSVEIHYLIKNRVKINYTIDCKIQSSNQSRDNEYQSSRQIRAGLSTNSNLR